MMIGRMRIFLLSFVGVGCSEYSVVTKPPVTAAADSGVPIDMEEDTSSPVGDSGTPDEETGEPKQYRIVGDLEANINENKISISSPIAKALLGKKVDDLVSIRAPKGDREYMILDIEY